MKNISIELSKFNSVNYLWSETIEKFGFERAKKLLSQANDLQKMNGIKDTTIPIVFSETGGLALISINLIEQKEIMLRNKGNKILIFNPKKKIFQILYDCE